MHGIIPLRRAISILQSAKEQVTALHTQFALLCLKARCLQHAESVIDHPITSMLSGMNPLEIFTYNSYRGMIFMGLERYTDAIECFRKVLS